MVQLMPLPPHHLFLIKIQNGLTFLGRLTQLVLEKRLLDRCLFLLIIIMSSSISSGLTKDLSTDAAIRPVDSAALGIKETVLVLRVLTTTLLHLFNGLFSRTTWVSQHQKGKPCWILLEQEIMGVAVASAGPYANHLHVAPDR